MRERQVVPFPQENYTQSSEPATPSSLWNIPEISDVLGNSPEFRHDPDFGEGVSFPIGQESDSDGTLVVYPEAGVVDYYMPDVGLTLKDVAPPDVFDNGILFTRESETHDQSLAISSEGRVVFVSDRKSPAPLATAPAQKAPLPANDEIQERIAAYQPPEEFSNTKPQAITKAETKKAERVEIPGRVGRDPRTHETKTGTLIAKFPLAEHPDGDETQTIWHTIVSFRDQAAFVRDNVHKGQSLKVIGYRNEREYNGKTYEEINAVAIRLPKNPGGANEQASNSE